MTSNSNDQLRDLVAHASTHEPEKAVERATEPMVGFRIGTRWLAVPAGCVREVVTLEAITPVPNVRAHVLGVALIRGRLVAAIDLPKLLNISRAGDVAATRPRLLVIQRGSDEVCVVADETRGVLELARISDAPTTGVVRGELRWEQHLIAVLDAAALVAVVAQPESGR